MGINYNVYCDESCHLENDHQDTMVLGSIWCPKDKVSEIQTRIKEIKNTYGFKSNFEVKWTKVSPKKIDFYLHLIDYFFDTTDLHFRCLVIPNKSKIDKKNYNIDHDGFYYRMYFNMLKVILNPEDRYNIYIDIKDTRGGSKVKELHNVICNSMYDFNSNIVHKMQIVKSHEVSIMQITDLIIGAISHLQRGITTSEAKQKIIKRIEDRSKYSLLKSTLYKEEKFNLFIADRLSQ